MGLEFYKAKRDTPLSCAAVIIAASDSLHPERADYICDGDSSMIQGVIDQIGSGKSIFVMSGDYRSASVTLGENQTMILENGVTNLSIDASASGAKVIRHSGIIIYNVITKTSNYTASNGDCVLANASSGAITITLPSPSSNAIVNVKKIDSSTNAVTVEPNGSETINGSSSKTIDTQYESYTFISDGTNWYII